LVRFETPDFSLDAPNFATPKVTEYPTQRIVVDHFIQRLDLPGDSPAERRARKFLHRLMGKYPAGLPGKIKRDFAGVCRRRFGISGRTFERLWDWSIDQTGATGFRKSGPRGPHGSQKR